MCLNTFPHAYSLRARLPHVNFTKSSWTGLLDMKLVSFSVANYRSITKANKIPLSDYSLLIGANNEGKSNILHALALGMNALVDWKRQVRRTADGRVVRAYPTSMIGTSHRLEYDWQEDYPISKQERAKPDSTTDIILEFELNEAETADFKDEIKSNLNGTLPLLIQFGQRGNLDVTVRKPGRGQATLTKKSTRIADFVSRRISFEYIPAIRTAQSASRVIEQLLSRELFRLEEDPDYQAAVAKIEELQQPVLDDLADTIQTTVAGFLPSVKSVELKTRRDARYRSLRRDVEIIVDDGNLTKLERKGDGVQSLVALALMRHASDQSSVERNTIVAIEEPESHLHPHAVHELRSVIEGLAEKNQVVLTSHSPLFVDPDSLDHTIIVKGSKAGQAKHVSEVRETLGVRFSDNLENARLVLLVEGADDVIAMKAIVANRSEILARAMSSGTITFDHLGGASGLRQKASFYQSGACLVQAFVDDDAAGKHGVQRAIDDKVLALKDVNLCVVPNLDEAELEDLYDKSLYREAFFDEFGVDPTSKPLGKKKQKWSSVMERLFSQAGKPWNDAIKFQVKAWLANYASAHAGTILIGPLTGPIDSFIQSVESKLPQK